MKPRTARYGANDSRAGWHRASFVAPRHKPLRHGDRGLDELRTGVALRLAKLREFLIGALETEPDCGEILRQFGDDLVSTGRRSSGGSTDVRVVKLRLELCECARRVFELLLQVEDVAVLGHDLCRQRRDLGLKLRITAADLRGRGRHDVARRGLRQTSALQLRLQVGDLALRLRLDDAGPYVCAEHVLDGQPRAAAKLQHRLQSDGQRVGAERAILERVRDAVEPRAELDVHVGSLGRDADARCSTVVLEEADEDDDGVLQALHVAHQRVKREVVVVDLLQRENVARAFTRDSERVGEVARGRQVQRAAEIEVHCLSKIVPGFFFGRDKNRKQNSFWFRAKKNPPSYKQAKKGNKRTKYCTMLLFSASFVSFVVRAFITFVRLV